MTLQKNGRVTVVGLALAAFCWTPAFAQSDATAAQAEMQKLFNGLSMCHKSPGGSAPPEFFVHDALNMHDDSTTTMTVGLFPCGAGAYNLPYVVMLDDGFSTEIAALPKVLDQPVFETSDGVEKLTTVEVRGMGAAIIASNLRFNPETGMLLELHKLRGLGDASTVTTWILRNRSFELDHHFIDFTLDGNIDHFQLVRNGLPIDAVAVKLDF